MDKRDAPDPVTGYEIGLSKSTTTIFILGSGFMFLLTAIWLVGGLISIFKGNDYSLRILVLSLGGNILMAVTCGLQVRSLWVKRRLVIGTNCLQMVEVAQGEDGVVSQLPYECIDSVKRTRVDFGYRIDFELGDSEHPDIYLPNQDLEQNFEKKGYHHAFKDSYQEDAAEVVWLIRRALKQWRRENESSHEENPPE